MCPGKPFWLATDLAICRWLTSVQSVCDVGLGIRKGRWRLRPADFDRRIRATALDRGPGSTGLLFQKAAILLEAGVPAANFHAE